MKIAMENYNISNIVAQNIDCECTLEPHRRGGSNEYPQSMFWIIKKKEKKINIIPLFIQVLLSKLGFRRYTFHGHVFLMFYFTFVTPR